MLNDKDYAQKYCVGLIPAYKPDKKLISTIKGCLSRSFLKKIVIVDDGSGNDFTALFEDIKQISNCIVLHLAINSGMGGAIKYGIQYILYNFPDTVGIVTFDADGQHLPEDIEKATAAFKKQDGKHFVIGVRDFHSHDNDIPFRSRFGNLVSEWVFRLLTGVHVSDTQTGLRVYPRHVAEKLPKILHNRYEFQLEALLLGVTESTISEIKINTVYEDNNKCSHFNPVLDSIRIYAIFLKFALSSLICSIVDYLIFAVMFLMTSHILFSLIVSRVGSVSLNFILNRNKVFANKGNVWVQGCKFVLLAMFLFAGSFYGISFLKNHCNWSPLVSKILVEIILFVISFVVQRLWIFSFNGSKRG